MTELEVKLYPAWRQAERDLIAQSLTYGQIVSDDWLRDAFGIREPKTIPEVERARLVFLSQTQALRESLLKNHNMMLRRTEGLGYVVVLPEQQTALAMRDRTREVKHALRKLAEEISHVDTTKLTDDQRKENSDAIAKLGTLRSMVRKQLNGTEPES